jgi:plastocyanin
VTPNAPILGTPSSSSAAPALNMIDYSNTALGITLLHPSEWTIGSVKNGIQVIKEKDETYVEIRAQDEKTVNIDLKEYANDDIADRKKSREGFKLIDEISDTTISGNVPAYKGTYSFVKTESPGKGDTQKVLRLWTILEDKLYTLAYVSNLENFDIEISAADAIINSIQSGEKRHSQEDISQVNQGVNSEIQERIMPPPSSTGANMQVHTTSSVPGSDPIPVSETPKPQFSEASGQKLFLINIGAKDSRSQNPIFPKALTVTSGTVVTWLNNDDIDHRIVSGNPDEGPTNVFYGEQIKPGEKYILITDAPGVYDFYDPIWSNIKGTLTVLAQPGGSTPLIH